jgi:hypothetical protein
MLIIKLKMLEETLQKTKATNYLIDLHPSANRLFKTDNNFEKKYFGYSKQIKYKAELNKISPFMKDKAKLIGGKFVHPIAYTVYGSAEFISRTSETICRGISRSIKYLAGKVYNSFDKEEKTNFKKKVKREKKVLFAMGDNLIDSFTYNKQSKESKRKVKDVFVVGISIYATLIGLSYIIPTPEKPNKNDVAVTEQVKTADNNIEEKIE